MSGNCKSSKTFQKPIEFQYFFIYLLRLLCVGPVIMNIRTIAMNWKYKNPLQSNKSIASCLRQLKTKDVTHIHTYTKASSIYLFWRVQKMWNQWKWSKVRETVPTQDLSKSFWSKTAYSSSFFHNTDFPKQKPNKELIYIFQEKQKHNSENNKILRNPFAEAPFVSVYGASEGLSFEFLLLLLLFWSQNTKDCNEIGMKASEREVLS